MPAHGLSKPDMASVVPSNPDATAAVGPNGSSTIETLVVIPAKLLLRSTRAPCWG